MPVLEQLVVAKRERPGPDEAHLALEDVDDLRDLVEREAAEDTPDAGDARIVTDLEERTLGLVRVLEPGLQGRRFGDHRPELEHRELSLAHADPPVDVENRAARAELDRERDQQPERQDEHGDERR